MSQYPKDPLVGGNFFKQRKQYAKLCKNKRVQYRQSLITRLDALNEENPKLYWNLINHLLDKNNTVDTPIHPDRWLDHFMKLNEVDKSYSDRINVLNKKLSELEKTTVLTN